jgi:hypothetical protein
MPWSIESPKNSPFR